MNRDDQSEPADSIVAFALTTKRRLQLQLEPEGMIYDIAPDQRVEVRIVTPQAPPQVVVHDDAFLSVWCEGFAAVFIDGVDVDSRLPTKAEIAYFRSDEYRDFRQRPHPAQEFIEKLQNERPDEWVEIRAIIKARLEAGDMTGVASRDAFKAFDQETRFALKYSGILPLLNID